MKATGMPLSKLDKMKENSSAFWKLNDVQREQFLEKAHDDFELVCSRLEKKGLNLDTPIAKVVEMKTQRIKQGVKF